MSVFRADQGDALNHDRRDGYVCHTALPSGFNRGDSIYDTHAIGDFTKYRIACSANASVQKIIIGNVDEKLGGGGVRRAGASHRNGATKVGQSLAAFILDRSFGGLLGHFSRESTALDHEAGYHAMEKGVVIETVFHIGEEVLNGFRRYVGP